ncbi:Muniscin C-terminal mu homology domain-containing protein [Mucor mucedo]|uniref:Muniscin C-terminal mu homology domain-containing protein n=1 Tax=Mucor mucedo TaxID=29922 RepID=UPI0022209F80|nr:Muniscin C-terminal mu homology domain-containing protein [Mucor mucedo]KAI7896742.1 Muniscin C-terminal mu homology domain-containing protein [Mucor mucedo]
MYAKSIAKLTRKNYISNKSALGTFLPLWEMLQLELSRAASIHTEYATSILENVEQPLRSCIPSSNDFHEIQRMDEHVSRIARDYDDLEIKIQKHKKSAKGEQKAAECIKQQDLKLAEWKQHGPEYLHKHQLLDEARWNTIKCTTEVFSSLQQSHAHKIIEMTVNTMTAAENIKVNDEIAAFCASTSHPPSHNHHQHEPQDLLTIDQIVPEPSISDSSLKHPPSVKKEKKRFFQSLVSMRRKPKSENGGHISLDQPVHGRQRSFSNAGSFVESLHSINTHSTADELGKSTSTNAMDLSTPGSPTSNTPSLRKATSFNGSITSALSSQPAPLIVVDSEGFSIPPSDRSAWPIEALNTKTESLLDLDDVGSDGGSVFSSNPRIRVDIKSEVTEEDASQSAVALTRVVTMLKEKNSSTGPNARRLRGRREMRATQLYSVVEGDQTLGNPAPLFNPFEQAPEKIAEEPITEENVVSPQIHVAITETLHVLSRAGEAERSMISGEVSIQYEGPMDPSTPVLFKLSHAGTTFDTIETAFLEETLEENTFGIQTGLFTSGQSKVCIKYKAPCHQLPLSVKPIWKCDSEKSRLLVKYHKHRDFSRLENVVFATSVTGQVQNALSIPAGELVLSQSRIMWHLGNLEDPAEAVIKAQFTTLEQASPQPIAVRFELGDTLLTDVNIMADPSLLVHTTKSVKVGKYIAEI